MHRLIVMTKMGTPRLITLQAGRTRIGRDANNAVVLDSVKVTAAMRRSTPRAAPPCSSTWAASMARE